MYAYSAYATRRIIVSDALLCIKYGIDVFWVGSFLYLEGYPHLIFRQAIKRLAQAVVGAHRQRHSLKEQNSLGQSPKEKG